MSGCFESEIDNSDEDGEDDPDIVHSEDEEDIFRFKPAYRPATKYCYTFLKYQYSTNRF